jgi:hypothetical protein
MFKYIVILILLSGCASESDLMDQIKSDYRVFADECLSLNGNLSIDRPVNERRVQNAPVTVWEMRDAICSYPGERPIRMYY